MSSFHPGQAINRIEGRAIDAPVHISGDYGVAGAGDRLKQMGVIGAAMLSGGGALPILGAGANAFTGGFAGGQGAGAIPGMPTTTGPMLPTVGGIDLSSLGNLGSFGQMAGSALGWVKDHPELLMAGLGAYQSAKDSARGESLINKAMHVPDPTRPADLDPVFADPSNPYSPSAQRPGAAPQSAASSAWLRSGHHKLPTINGGAR